MPEFNEQTSASDRYEAARKALAFNEAVDRGESVAERTARDNLADALRALITPPRTGETVEQIAARALNSFPPPYTPGAGYSHGELEQLAIYAARAGIQNAHETWECEDRPTQEQMLRWLGINARECEHEGELYLAEQHIEKED